MGRSRAKGYSVIILENGFIWDEKRGDARNIRGMKNEISFSLHHAANASEISLGHQREQLLGDVQERVGDFAEWRMDYSRQLAKYAVRPLRCVAPRTAALPPVLCVWRLAQLSCT